MRDNQGCKCSRSNSSNVGSSLRATQRVRVAPVDNGQPTDGEPLDRRRAVAGQASLGLVFALLASAAFFDGYDAQILALLLPQIQDSFHASVTALGIAHIPIALGQFVAFFVIRQADRVGRRPLLLVTILGYTAFTAATAAAWDLASFTILQFGAQVFIGAEFGVAVTMLVEVFPKERRGRALGVLLTFGPVGAVVVAVLLDAGLQDTALGWRLFYLIGLVPLAVVAIGRRRLPETARFEAERRRRAQGISAPRVSFLEPWLSQYRGRLVLVGLVSLLQTLPTSAAVAWWAYYAERQRGLSTEEVATYVIFAYGAGLFGYYSCGRLMDRIGRRPTAIIYILCTVVAGIGVFQSGRGLASPLLLAVAVFFGLGIGPVLSAFATELFPTRIRAQASSWVRNWFAVVGSVLGPALVGVLGDPYHGAIGNIGNTVSLLMLVALPAAFLVWRYMPETRGVELDEVVAPSAAGRGGKRGASQRGGNGKRQAEATVCHRPECRGATPRSDLRRRPNSWHRPTAAVRCGPELAFRHSRDHGLERPPLRTKPGRQGRPARTCSRLDRAGDHQPGRVHPHRPGPEHNRW